MREGDREQGFRLRKVAEFLCDARLTQQRGVIRPSREGLGERVPGLLQALLLDERQPAQVRPAEVVRLKVGGIGVADLGGGRETVGMEEPAELAVRLPVRRPGGERCGGALQRLPNRWLEAGEVGPWHRPERRARRLAGGGRRATAQHPPRRRWLRRDGRRREQPESAEQRLDAARGVTGVRAALRARRQEEVRRSSLPRSVPDRAARWRKRRAVGAGSAPRGRRAR